MENELRHLMPDVHMEKIDVDHNTDFAAKYGIKSVPTVLLFRDGTFMQHIMGLRSAAEYKEVTDKVLSQG